MSLDLLRGDLDPGLEGCGLMIVDLIHRDFGFGKAGMEDLINEEVAMFIQEVTEVVVVKLKHDQNIWSSGEKERRRTF